MILSAPAFRDIHVCEAADPGAAVDRMPAFMGLEVDPRAVLADTRLLIVGAGSVAGRIAVHAARCRVGGIDVVDPKRFSPNFDTQPIRHPSEIGMPKAAVVGQWAKTISPESAVRYLDGSVQRLSWLDLDRYDVVLASTDNLPVEVHLGAACRALGKPLIYAAVHGPTLTSQVRVFVNGDDDGPCPYCHFSREERALMSAGVRYSCDPGATPHGEIVSQPTVSVAPLCSLAAAAAMIELLRMRLRLGPAPRDMLREINGYGGTAVTTPLVRNRQCPVDHAVLRRAGIERPLRECTLRQCARATGTTGDEGIARLCFAVDDCLFSWVLICGRCGASRNHNEFVDRRSPLVQRRCSSCGHLGLAPHPFYSFDRLIPAAGGGLMPHLDVPLGSLGAAGRGVVVRGGDRAILVQSTAITNGNPS